MKLKNLVTSPLQPIFFLTDTLKTSLAGKFAYET